MAEVARLQIEGEGGGGVGEGLNENDDDNAQLLWVALFCRLPQTSEFYTKTNL